MNILPILATVLALTACAMNGNGRVPQSNAQRPPASAPGNSEPQPNGSLPR